MAKSAKQITSVQLSEVEFLKFQNITLRLQSLEIQKAAVLTELAAVRESTNKRLGINVSDYDFDNKGLGKLKSAAPQIIPLLPKPEEVPTVKAE